MLNLPVKVSARHDGKVLQVNSETETMTLIGQTDETLGTVSWEAVIDLIQSSGKPSRSQRTARNFSRSQLAATLRYVTPDRKDSKGVTCEIGGGGIFIETTTLSEVGTVLTLELALPDDPSRPITAQGKVAWIRPREERHVFAAGMGVQFTEISEESRARIVNMVKSLDQWRGGN